MAPYTEIGMWGGTILNRWTSVWIFQGGLRPWNFHVGTKKPLRFSTADTLYRKVSSILYITQKIPQIIQTVAELAYTQFH